MDVLTINTDDKLAALPQTTECVQDGLIEQATESRYRELVELSPIAVIIIQQRCCVFANASALELFGAFTPEELLEKPVLSMFSGQHLVLANVDLHQILQGQKFFRTEQQLMRLDGIIIDVELIINHFYTAAGEESIQLVAYDISERKRAEAHVEYLAYYDQLTNLPNRLYFINKMAAYLEQAKQDHYEITLIAIEISLLHEINTIYGNKAGDGILEQVAARLQSTVEGVEILSRFSGNQFYLLFLNKNHSQVVELADTIVKTLAEPFDVDGEPLIMSSYLGIAAKPDVSDDAESLIQSAILALYQAKSEKNRIVFYQKEMNEALTQQHSVQVSLEHALESGDQLMPFFQPQVHLAAGSLFGVEALVRWQHPEWGLVSPARFIPVAEKCGLIETLDEVVLQQSCRLIQSCRLQDGPPLQVACNLSARQFRRSNLVERISKVLAETGLPPSLLEIEITENVIMENVEHAVGILRQLRDLGISLAIDDFGTGYSSLNYLTRFPVQTVKIDQMFIQRLFNSPSDTAIARAIITLAHTLNMTVLAEGVETRDQLAFLCGAGCDAIQGYLISRPIPVADFQSRLPLFHKEIEAIFATL